MSPPPAKRAMGRPSKPIEELSSRGQVHAAKRIWASIENAPYALRYIQRECEKTSGGEMESKLMAIITSLNCISPALSQFSLELLLESYKSELLISTFHL